MATPRRRGVIAGRAVYPSHGLRAGTRYPWLALCLTALLLAGCASGPQVPSEPPPTLEPAAESPEALLRRAARATRRSAAALRLEAALAYAGRGDLAAAAGVLETVDPSVLDGGARWRLEMLAARLALAGGDAAAARARLERIPDARFSDAFGSEDVVELTRLRAEVLTAVGEPLQAARQRIFVDGLLQPEDRAANRQQIWVDLSMLDMASIDAARAAASREPDLRGWLELARIARGMHPTLEAQQREVELWRRRWEDHPAQQALPERLARLPELIASRPRHVALLLPLTGDLAGAGKAIRDGFIAAQYEAARTGVFTPRLSIFDSASLGALSGYLQAVDAGAELVVGPLSKGGVDILIAQPELEVPVLALNGTSDGRTAAGVIQFALLPEEEGRQLAERLYDDGARRALLLLQAAPWSERIERAFSDRFTELGGDLLQTQAFVSTSEVGDAVAAALLVSESEARARILRRLLGVPMEFEPRRRQDVDAVVAIADPVYGGTLKPALDYYFAGDLPVYASSQIHDPARAAAGNTPLAGIRFCDMPWRLLPLAERTRMQAAFPDSSAAVGIFQAIGVDAWRLHARLGGSSPGRDARLSGVTGDLWVAPDGRVRRDLVWALMAASGPTPLPRVMAAD